MASKEQEELPHKFFQRCQPWLQELTEALLHARPKDIALYASQFIITRYEVNIDHLLGNGGDDDEAGVNQQGIRDGYKALQKIGGSTSASPSNGSGVRGFAGSASSVLRTPSGKADAALSKPRGGNAPRSSPDESRKISTVESRRTTSKASRASRASSTSASKAGGDDSEPSDPSFAVYLDAQDVLSMDPDSEEAEAILRKIFDYYDADGDGYLNYAEFSTALNATSIGLTEEEIAMEMQEVDPELDGDVTFKAFKLLCLELICAVFARAAALEKHEEALSETMEQASAALKSQSKSQLAQLFSSVFVEYDLDDDQLLTYDEFRKCVRAENLGLSETEIDALTAKADPEKSSFISYSNFVPVFAEIMYLNQVRELLREEAIALMLQRGQLGELSAHLQNVFQSYDDGGGRFRPEQLRHILENSGLSLSRILLSTMVGMAAVDSDGTVDYSLYISTGAYLLNYYMRCEALRRHRTVKTMKRLSSGYMKADVVQKATGFTLEEYDRQVRAAFTKLDKDGDGFIGAVELREYFVSKKWDIGEDVVQSLVKSQGIGKNHELNFNAFRRILYEILEKEALRMDVDVIDLKRETFEEYEAKVEAKRAASEESTRQQQRQQEEARSHDLSAVSAPYSASDNTDDDEETRYVSEEEKKILAAQALFASDERVINLFKMFDIDSTGVIDFERVSRAIRKLDMVKHAPAAQKMGLLAMISFNSKKTEDRLMEFEDFTRFLAMLVCDAHISGHVDELLKGLLGKKPTTRKVVFSTSTTGTPSGSRSNSAEDNASDGQLQSIPSVWNTTSDFAFVKTEEERFEMDAELVEKIMELSLEEFEEETKRAFVRADKDEDGLLSYAELLGYFHYQSLPMGPSATLALISLFGGDDECVDFQAFRRIVYDVIILFESECLEEEAIIDSEQRDASLMRHKTVKRTSQDPRLLQLFNLWDVEHTGDLGFRDLVQALSSLEELKDPSAAVRLSMRALVKYDALGTQTMDAKYFGEFMVDLCRDVFKCEFADIADHLLEVANRSGLKRTKSGRTVRELSGGGSESRLARTVTMDAAKIEDLLGINVEQFIHELRQSFEEADVNNDGLLGVDELYPYFRSQKMLLNKESVIALIAIFDVGKGMIDFRAFKNICYDLLVEYASFQEQGTEERLESFRSARSARASEVREAAKDARMKELFSAWDVGKKGFIDFHDLAVALRSIDTLQDANSSVRLAVYSLLAYDDKATQTLSYQAFSELIVELCHERYGLKFDEIADALLTTTTATKQNPPAGSGGDEDGSLVRNQTSKSLSRVQSSQSHLARAKSMHDGVSDDAYDKSVRANSRSSQVPAFTRAQTTRYMVSSKLEEVLGVTVDEFTMELKEAFANADVDGDGLLNLKELQSYFDRNKFGLSPAAVSSLIRAFNCSVDLKDMAIDFRAFKKIIYDMSVEFASIPEELSKDNIDRIRRVKQNRDNPMLEMVFSAWDSKKKGYIDFKDLAKSLRHFEKIEDAEGSMRLSFYAMLAVDCRADTRHANNNRVTLDRFAEFITDLCDERFGIEFDEIADYLLEAAEELEADDKTASGFFEEFEDQPALFTRSSKSVVMDADRVSVLLGITVDEYKNELKESFTKADRNNDGYLDFAEFKAYLEKEKIPIDRSAVRALINMFDVGGKRIDFRAFRQIIYDMTIEYAVAEGNFDQSVAGSLHAQENRKRRRSKSDPRMQALFKAWDFGDKGYVDFNDISKELKNLDQIRNAETTVRVTLQALLSYDSRGLMHLEYDDFVGFILDVCMEEYGIDFNLLADHLLDAATKVSSQRNQRNMSDTAHPEASDPGAALEPAANNDLVFGLPGKDDIKRKGTLGRSKSVFTRTQTVRLDESKISNILGVSASEFLDELKESFQAADVNKDGFLDTRELVAYVEREKLPIDAKGIRALVRLYDVGGGRMDFRGFKRMMYGITVEFANQELVDEVKTQVEDEAVVAAKSDERMKALYHGWDCKNKGYVDFSDLVEALKKLDELSDEEGTVRTSVHAFLSYDKHGAFALTYVEFVLFMLDFVEEFYSQTFDEVADKMVERTLDDSEPQGESHSGMNHVGFANHVDERLEKGKVGMEDDEEEGTGIARIRSRRTRRAERTTATVDGNRMDHNASNDDEDESPEPIPGIRRNRTMRGINVTQVEKLLGISAEQFNLELKESFLAADKNGDGFLDYDELLLYMQSIDTDLDEMEIQELIVKFDVGTDSEHASTFRTSKIDFRSFKRISFDLLIAAANETREG